MKSVLDLLARNPRPRFSASYSTYFHTHLKQIREQLYAIDQIDKAAFCNSGPDSEFAYQMATFLTYRLLEIDKDELALLADSRDAPEGLTRRIWAQEMALVYSEARDEASPHALPLDFSELDDSVRRLQILMHDRGRTVTRGECDELWNEYTKISRGGKLVPDVNRGRLTPFFFHLLRSLKMERRLWFGAEDLDEDDGEFSVFDKVVVVVE